MDFCSYNSASVYFFSCDFALRKKTLNIWLCGYLIATSAMSGKGLPNQPQKYRNRCSTGTHRRKKKINLNAWPSLLWVPISLESISFGMDLSPMYEHGYWTHVIEGCPHCCCYTGIGPCSHLLIAVFWSLCYLSGLCECNIVFHTFVYIERDAIHIINHSWMHCKWRDASCITIKELV